MDSFLAFFGEENLERKMYPMYVVKEEYVVVCVKGLMWLSRVQRERESELAQDLSHRGLHSSRLQRSKRW